MREQLKNIAIIARATLKMFLIGLGIILAGYVTCNLFILLIYYYFPESPGMDAAYNPVWSPDGNTIAFACAFYRKEDRDFEGVFDPPLRDICLISRDGTQLRRITQERGYDSPAWSPDGRYLAWWAGREDGVMILDLETDQQRLYPTENERLHFDLASGDWLEWSLDGKKILFQGCSLHLDVMTGAVRSAPNYDPQQPCWKHYWSKDGERLFSIEREEPDNFNGTDFKLHIYNLDTLLVSYDVEMEWVSSAAWNSEGTMVAWNGKGLNEKEVRLFITNPSNGTTVEIQTDDEYYRCYRLDWLPNQQKLFCDDWGEAFLFVVDGDWTDGNFKAVEERSFKDFPVQVTSVVLAPDQGSYLYQTSEARIWLVPENGKPKKLAP